MSRRPSDSEKSKITRPEEQSVEIESWYSLLLRASLNSLRPYFWCSPVSGGCRCRRKTRTKNGRIREEIPPLRPRLNASSQKPQGPREEWMRGSMLFARRCWSRWALLTNNIKSLQEDSPVMNSGENMTSCFSVSFGSFHGARRGTQMLDYAKPRFESTLRRMGRTGAKNGRSTST